MEENKTVTFQTYTTEPLRAPSTTDAQMLAEILDNSRKTKNYIKWQLIITVAFVVLPLLAALIIGPLVVSSMMSTFDVIDPGRGDGATPIDQIYQLLQ